MAWIINAPIYDLKTNLSKYIRALNRGAADLVIIRRYGREVGKILPGNGRDGPALAPVTASDLEMWRRAVYNNGPMRSRRGKPTASRAE